MTTTVIPDKQRAVQLIGADQLRLTESKPVYMPGPYQILCQVEVCGLCFSDLKLLKQFSQHARKSEVKAGISPKVLSGMPHYVPGDKPTVPGHETVVRVVKVGTKAGRFHVGERYLVQTDYRWLPTTSSASAFGYNFEGALQEFVLVDERVITAPSGESMFIPAPEGLSASAIALCEPWACVEDAYVDKQRQTLKNGGQLLVVTEASFDKNLISRLSGKPARATTIAPDKLGELKDKAYDDVVYFGANPETVEKLWSKVAVAGLVNLVQCGGKFGRPVVTAVGRVHYGGIRIVGTTGGDPAAAMAYIPATAEIQPNDKINIIGAAGPMGTMHVIRDLCQGVPGVAVFAGDLSEERLSALMRIAEPLAQRNRLTLHPYNPQKDKLSEQFDYVVVMAPVPALVARSVNDAAARAIINIFAGVPPDVTAEIDLDAYVEKQCYFVGTSGSTLDDMKTVLQKVASGKLDTNLSVAAIAGLDGAIDGIRAVEENLLPGKILVYPFARGMKLTPLPELAKEHPAVARALHDGHWDLDAESTLKRDFAKS